MYFFPENSVAIINKFIDATERAIEKYEEFEQSPKKQKTQQATVVITHFLGEANIFLANWCNIPPKKFGFRIDKERKKRPSNNKLGYTEHIERIDITYWRIDSANESRRLSIPKPLQSVIFRLEEIVKWQGWGSDLGMLKQCKRGLEELKEESISNQTNIYNLPECLEDLSKFRIDDKILNSSESQQKLFACIRDCGIEGATWETIVERVIRRQYFRNISDFFKGTKKGKILRQLIVEKDRRFRLSNRLRIVSSLSE